MTKKTEQQPLDVKALLASVAIKPGDIPKLKFDLKRTVIRASTSVPKNTFFRAHPDCEQLFMMVPSGREMESRMYIIGPGLSMPAHLADSIVAVCCHLIVFPDGELRILERKTAHPGEPMTEYQQSSLNVITAARRKWVMRQWNKRAGVYDYVEADQSFAPEPSWPEEDFMTLLEKAYEGRIIDAEDHPIYLELAGKKAADDSE